MRKKLFSGIAALVLLTLCLPVLAETAEARSDFRYLPSSVPAISGNQALEGYINYVLGPDTGHGITLRNAPLSGLASQLYHQLVPLIEEVAAGEEHSTVFEVEIPGNTEAFSGETFRKLTDALLFNLPYHLYWYDKTAHVRCSFSSTRFTFSFPVAAEYSADGSTGTYAVNTGIGSAITAAGETAQGIVTANRNKSDLEKLTAYKNAICSLVSYNQGAADDDSMPYGNPWQLIWVFDGDPDTNVVCEGYSKAFKYLCDLSSFRNQNISVSLVSGDMTGATGAGPHMWNLVAVDDGPRYLADITNCDEGSVGSPDLLFMAGYSEPYSGSRTGYVFTAGNQQITYLYDDDTLNSYPAGDLTVSETAYTPPAGPQIVADGICGDDLTWTLDENGLLTVSGTGEMYGGWNEEENPWAGHKAEILHAVVEQGVTSLGLAAFRECVNLTDISLPDTLTYIGYQALGGCYSLTGVTIPDSVTFIGRWAFSGCPITSITIPSAVAEIEFGAFSYCDQLEEIIIADGNPSYLVDENGVLFTADQTKLLWYPIPRTRTSYTVPDTVTTLDGNAFSVCVNLQEIILPAGLSTIGASAFDQCQNLTDVYFQGDENTWSALSIQDGNGALTDAWLHYIRAFGSCGENLTWTLDNEGTLTVSGTGEMYGGWDDEENPWADYKAEILHAVVKQGVTSLGLAAFRDCIYLTDISLPDSLTHIGYQAFSGCYSLTRVTIPDSVTFIGRWAFSGCPITSITIPAGVTEIEFGAFSYCDQLEEIIIADGNPSYLVDENGVLFTADQTKLLWYPIPRTRTSYTVPDTVTTLDGNAFSVCVNLQEIILPAGLSTIGASAFDQCQNLTDVYFQGDENTWSALSIQDGNGALTDARLHYIRAFGSCGENLTWTLDNEGTLTVSGTGSMDDYDIEYAYDGAEYQRYGTSPWYALRDQILDIAVEPGVTSVGSYAFMDCGQVSGLSLPDSITAIGQGAFRKCSGLTSFALPAGVTDIGPYAFAGCSSIAAFTVAGGNTAFTAEDGVLFSYDRSTLLSYPPAKTDPSYTVPESVTEIGALAFASCKSLTDVLLGSHVSSIGESAFEGCSSLTGLTIPDSVVYIEPFAFNYCTGLTSLTVGTGLDFVGLCSFNACDSLTDVFYKGSRARWNRILIGDENGPLLTAEKHYHAGVPVPEVNLALPAALTEIESEAFAGLPAGTVVLIPDTVTAIADGAFDEGTVFIATENSFAAEWATDHGFDCFEQ